MVDGRIPLAGRGGPLIRESSSRGTGWFIRSPGVERRYDAPGFNCDAFGRRNEYSSGGFLGGTSCVGSGQSLLLTEFDQRAGCVFVFAGACRHPDRVLAVDDHVSDITARKQLTGIVAVLGDSVNASRGGQPHDALPVLGNRADLESRQD